MCVPHAQFLTHSKQPPGYFQVGWGQASCGALGIISCCFSSRPSRRHAAAFLPLASDDPYSTPKQHTGFQLLAATQMLDSALQTHYSDSLTHFSLSHTYKGVRFSINTMKLSATSCGHSLPVLKQEQSITF